MKKTTLTLLIGILFCMVPSPAATKDAMQGPWDSRENKNETPIADNSVFSSQPGEFSFNPLLWIVRLFRSFLSSVDGPRCSMYPTCSHYSLLAFKKHGPVLGYIMTADRLIHESDEPRFVSRIEKHGYYRYYDPINNNDFWWHEPDPKTD